MKCYVTWFKTFLSENYNRWNRIFFCLLVHILYSLSVITSVEYRERTENSSYTVLRSVVMIFTRGKYLYNFYLPPTLKVFKNIYLKTWTFWCLQHICTRGAFPPGPSYGTARLYIKYEKIKWYKYTIVPTVLLGVKLQRKLSRCKYFQVGREG